MSSNVITESNSALNNLDTIDKRIAESREISALIKQELKAIQELINKVETRIKNRYE